jgi:hypothetical protein
MLLSGQMMLFPGNGFAAMPFISSLTLLFCMNVKKATCILHNYDG